MQSDDDECKIIEKENEIFFNEKNHLEEDNIMNIKNIYKDKDKLFQYFEEIIKNFNICNIDMLDNLLYQLDTHKNDNEELYIGDILNKIYLLLDKEVRNNEFILKIEDLNTFTTINSVFNNFNKITFKYKMENKFDYENFLKLKKIINAKMTELEDNFVKKLNINKNIYKKRKATKNRKRNLKKKNRNKNKKKEEECSD